MDNTSKPRAASPPGRVRTSARRPPHPRRTSTTAPIGRLAAASALLLAFGLSLAPLLAWMGIGVHRRAQPAALIAASILLVYGPALLVAGLQSHRRTQRLALALGLWSIASFLVLPVWFPGERSEAVATSLAALGFPSGSVPRTLAERLPDEPALSTPQLQEAAPLERPAALPPQPIGENQIALPYEGEGRRMSVPVIFGSAGGREVEVDMLLDTGATYTTLDHTILSKLGIKPSKRDPVIRLHTANGEREAALVLVDHVWLGDLKIDGVAIAVCDDCAGSDTAGLLGLNVVGGFNLSIDADRKEVIFSRRTSFDRKLDIKPFVDLDATFTRFPGGRVEVVVNMANRSERLVRKTQTQIRCREEHWTVTTEAVAAGEQTSAHRKLPEHEPCREYEISLLSADW